jgi:hypothetical protein
MHLGNISLLHLFRCCFPSFMEITQDDEREIISLRTGRPAAMLDSIDARFR